MKLAEYISSTKTKPAQFARDIGVGRSSVHRYCTGERRPDLDTLQKIHEATKGKVTAQDFFIKTKGSKRPKPPAIMRAAQ